MKQKASETFASFAYQIEALKEKFFTLKCLNHAYYVHKYNQTQKYRKPAVVKRMAVVKEFENIANKLILNRLLMFTEHENFLMVILF